MSTIKFLSSYNMMTIDDEYELFIIMILLRHLSEKFE